MDQNKELEPVSLSTMLGKDIFTAREGEPLEKKYRIVSLAICDIEEFRKDDLFIPRADRSGGYGQFVYLQNEEYRKTLDKWLQNNLFYNNEPVTFEMIMEHKWTLDDVGNFLRTLTRLSG